MKFSSNVPKSVV